MNIKMKALKATATEAGLAGIGIGVVEGLEWLMLL